MRSLFAMAAVLGLTVACSSPTSPTPGTITTGGFTTVILSRGTMSATVDGVRWTAAIPSGATTTVAGSQGALYISGLASGASPFTPGLFMSISGPLAVGSYSLDGSVPLAFSLSEGLNFRWSADTFRSGGATLTLTTATATRLVGTFSFTAVANTGTSPETRVVTNGAFDLSQ